METEQHVAELRRQMEDLRRKLARTEELALNALSRFPRNAQASAPGGHVHIPGEMNVTWAAQQDNFDSGGVGTINVTLTGNQTLTGMAGGTPGRLICIQNVDSTDTLTIADASASSVATNRFELTGAIGLAPGEGAIFQYKASPDARWYCVGGNSTSVGGGGTLDDAYDFGGAGSGRTINTTDGAVLLQTTEADAAPNLDLRRAVGDIAKAALQVGVNSEANPRLEIEAGGTINLGQGGASVVDVEIGSPSAQVVQIQVPGGAAATLKVANIAEQITNGRVAMTDGITVNQALGLTQAAATLTVGGQLTATHPWMVVTSNSGAADDMDNLATTGIATADGDTYLISAASGHTITIRDNSVSGGNISTMSGSAIVLDSIEKVAILVRDGTTYYAGTLFSTGGAGDVATDAIWDAAGDLAVGTGANTAARLPIGPTRLHLAVNAAANALEWVASPQSLMTTTGDILIASAANTPARLAGGAAGTYLAGQGAGVAPAYATPQSFRIHKLRPNAAPGAAIATGNGQDFSWTGNNAETVVKIMWICQTVGTTMTFGLRFASGVEDYDSVTLPLSTTIDTEAIGTQKGGTDTSFTNGTIAANSIIALDIDSISGTYKDLWVFMLTKLGLTT